jgi:death on curing protein
LIYPEIEQIIDLNRELINRYGGLHNGLDNLKNPGALEWVLDAIQYPLFGYDCYPEIWNKVGILSWQINAGHVFHDGNKRTSIFAMLQFLRVNAFQLNATTNELHSIAQIVATNKDNNFHLDDYFDWLMSRII